MTSQVIYKFFADYIYKHSGILYKESEYYRLDTRLNTLIKVLQLSTVEEVHSSYVSKITNDMHSLLINLATNNETYFLRDKKPFTTLVEKVLPECVEASPGMINIWCAGCSTGQEPYSILMAIDHKAGANLLGKVTIEATDISTEALKKAKNGAYDGLDVQRGLPVPLLVKYFTKDSDESWKISPSLMRKIRFGEFNLLKDSFPKDKYQVIFCRNVLIYQDKENRRAILQNFYNALRPGGYLFMGSGESIIGLDLSFKQNVIDGTLLYKKEA